MNKLLLASMLCLPLAASAQLAPKTVYGEDDRVDLYQVKDPKVLALADSTVALFEAAKIKIDGGAASLSLSPYGESHGLCKEERFWEQKNGAFCSGFLVAPDVIASAGHCVTSDEDCAGVRFVFGWGLKTEGATPESVPASEVYSCAKLIGRLQVNDGADWSLSKLDRPVTGHKPLALSKSEVANGDPLVVIGHPAGLPMKVAGGAFVRDASFSGFFRANTDSYHGNSGSPVFNGKTGIVEGILVRGETDYESKGSCSVSKVCPMDGCRGEDVTRTSAWAGNVPAPFAPPARVASFGGLQEALAELVSPTFDSAR